MLVRSKLKSIESKISEALINNEIRNGDFATIINEEKNYRESRESTGMMESQRNDTEKMKLIEGGKIIGIDKIIKRNEIINNNLKSQV